MMTRDDIVERVNQKFYEGMFKYEDMVDELDDAITAINNTMHTKFPMMSDRLSQPSSTYSDLDEDEERHPIFPEQYIRKIVIEYVIAELFRREGEFGNEYSVAVAKYEDELSNMFRDFYDKIPEEYIDENDGMFYVNPYQVDDVGE